MTQRRRLRLAAAAAAAAVLTLLACFAPARGATLGVQPLLTLDGSSAFRSVTFTENGAAVRLATDALTLTEAGAPCISAEARASAAALRAAPACHGLRVPLVNAADVACALPGAGADNQPAGRAVRDAARACGGRALRRHELQPRNGRADARRLGSVEQVRRGPMPTHARARLAHPGATRHRRAC
jgi:hypothetical protein